MTKLAKSNQFNRSGAVHYRVDHRDNGESSITLTVDYERAPVPDHSYVADFFEVSRSDADVLIVFGKIDFPKGDRLRNKIEIYFPNYVFVQQLWRSSRKFYETLSNSFEARSLKPKRAGGLSTETERVQTLSANNVLMINTAGHSILDFYLISAKDLWTKTRKGDPVGIEALVRVFTTEHLLLGFLSECDKIARSLKDELGIKETEESNEIMESVEF